MIIKLLTEHHLEFLSLKGGYRGSSESTLVKMSNCWKSHAAAHIFLAGKAGRDRGYCKCITIGLLSQNSWGHLHHFMDIMAYFNETQFTYP